jgi:hypothetical protein
MIYPWSVKNGPGNPSYTTSFRGVQALIKGSLKTLTIYDWADIRFCSLLLSAIIFQNHSKLLIANLSHVDPGLVSTGLHGQKTFNVLVMIIPSCFVLSLL